MSLSSHSPGGESRAASPDDENGKPRSQFETPPASSKPDRLAELKRRSTYAFSVFANEEREKLMKTHPDLPMGLVTRMMVDKWKSLDSEARMPYLDAARVPPLRMKKAQGDPISSSAPPKKSRPFIAYKTAAAPMPLSDQIVRVESCGEHQNSAPKIVYVQGKQINSVQEVPKTHNPSPISASIAQALGMSVVQQRTPSTVVTTHVNPPPLRASIPRPKHTQSTPASSQSTQASAATTGNDAQTRHDNNGCAFSSSQQALEMFYLALCEPAFPHPNEPPLTPYPANYCYDAYVKLTSGQQGLM